MAEVDSSRCGSGRRNQGREEDGDAALDPESIQSGKSWAERDAQADSREPAQVCRDARGPACDQCRQGQDRQHGLEDQAAPRLQQPGCAGRRGAHAGPAPLPGGAQRQRQLPHRLRAGPRRPSRRRLRRGRDGGHRRRVCAPSISGPSMAPPSRSTSPGMEIPPSLATRRRAVASPPRTSSLCSTTS